MANTFFTPQQVAATALSLLKDDMVFASTFNREYQQDFGAGKGATVNVRIPAALKARRVGGLVPGAAITADTLAETTTSVSLSDMTYSAVNLTDSDLTLGIADFARQVIKPQTDAISADIEALALATLQTVAATPVDIADPATVAGKLPLYSSANPDRQFVRARKMLRDNGAPSDGLYAAVGTGIYADLVASNLLTPVLNSGSNEALANANVMRLRGFNVIESNELADGEIIWYQGDSVTLAVVAPQIPQGAAFGASMSSDFGAIRWIRDYDPALLQDRSVFSAFLGAKVMPGQRIDRSGGTATVVPVPRIIRVVNTDNWVES
jgi:hypothetical protein